MVLVCPLLSLLFIGSNAIRSAYLVHLDDTISFCRAVDLFGSRMDNILPREAGHGWVEEQVPMKGYPSPPRAVSTSPATDTGSLIIRIDNVQANEQLAVHG